MAAQGTDSIPSPFVLFRKSPDEPSWAATFRLRGAEKRYVNDPRWRDVYCQIRAQSEVWLGDHAAALRFWDSCRGSRGDTAYTLPAGARGVDAIARIAAAADTARIVMVNERHHATSDRLLTLRLLPALRQKGYRYFAAEAFDWRDTAINHRAAAAEGVTGGYVDEPVFGEIVREARRLGYTLVPYEAEPGQLAGNDTLNPQQRRDHAQARNLHDRIFRTDPGAKVLVHAGYAHIQERPVGTWTPMAWYLRELTGIDPVTVDQTTLGEAGTPSKEHPAYRAAVAAGLVRDQGVVLVDSTGHLLPPIALQAVDMQVLTPRTTYTRARPDWMALRGRRHAIEVSVPECASRPCIIEARLEGDPDNAVPLDRTETREETVRLFLPADGRVRLRVLEPTGALLRTLELGAESRAGT
jgi:hypothetical protein